jgi:hypothetical protein
MPVSASSMVRGHHWNEMEESPSLLRLIGRRHFGHWKGIDMKIQRLLIAATLLNLILVLLVFAQARPVSAQSGLQVIRGRALEIVDDQGRVRASITIEPRTSPNQGAYPETVLLRMSDPNMRPVVKLTASEEGSSLGLVRKGESELHHAAP